jgi:DNA-binding transcriptional MerR regulator
VGEERPGAFGIGELSMRVGVTPRTVRYYVAEGLLPPPGGGGQNRVYTEEHLLRLRAIRRLKEAYLPLDEIRRRLSGASLAELQRLAEEPIVPPSSSALEYVTSLLSGPSPRAERAAAAPAPPAASPPATSADSVWRRVVLAPGVELHYQPTGDPDRDAAVARLIAEGARLLSAPEPPGDAPE